MNEEEFLKEHPGLKGKIQSEIEIEFNTGKKKKYKSLPYLDIMDVHKTQLDKQKVKGVIFKYIVEKTKGISFAKPINPVKLLKELGLE